LLVCHLKLVEEAKEREKERAGLAWLGCQAARLPGEANDEGVSLLLHEALLMPEFLLFFFFFFFSFFFCFFF